ncbi:SCP-2 sterol transfer family protein [Ketobacter sp. MCCC 1A13808]|uniref:SCP2 sterol-binding domain-containing protein n=1 Tax=Ketobacter sp. MCCC 1A13808 TaxID=2602738 RepID=UPI000F1AFF0F|nr:SCP2 sterol-binding domain-containing protein [Ketobacter sp. MCCC 1A13808]MVF12666.1 SCP-2 sterol transfer family protein [Ketobacter sp. MCCC 1A13808]RLP55539.1 MAG: SCP-2 sterol transfer family protein [Ketobacter sp.]
MSLKFLSDEWFAKVDELKAAAGDIEVPASMADLVINLTVTGTDSGDVDIALNAGMIEKGHKDGAPTKMILPVDLAQRLFIDNDQSAGMQGFMSGQIKIEGDMSKLMAMQTVQPSADQKALQKEILAVTAS